SPFNYTNLDEYQAQSPDSQGHVGWNELHGGEVNASLGFYTKLFGWEKKEAMDMGEMGPYQMFGKGDVTIGGMMKDPADWAAPPHWSYYINVDSIDQAAERVKSAGGQVVMGPQEVPGGDFVLTGTDPQGGFFSLV